MALLFKQFSSPLVLILLFGAGVSFWLRDISDAVTILVIVCTSALLSFWQESRASHAVAALRSRLALTSRVIRDGKETSVAAAELVPGDIVLLSAGNLVPADGLILEATDFLVTEAALTGESLPVEKKPGQVAADATISGRTNSVFTGSSVRSGTASVLVVHTGTATEFGKIAERLEQSEPETDFERGVRHFGSMLLKAMFLIVTFVLAINQLLGRPFVESMLFSVALAVGLSPELLPAIVTVTLSTGARHLASRGVIVRRLEAMENFGSMTVLCTDKTGTITTGEVALADATDARREAVRRGEAARIFECSARDRNCQSARCGAGHGRHRRQAHDRRRQEDRRDPLRFPAATPDGRHRGKWQKAAGDQRRIRRGAGHLHFGRGRRQSGQADAGEASLARILFQGKGR